MRSTSHRTTPVSALFTALPLGALLALGAVACGPADPAPTPEEDAATPSQESAAANEALTRQYLEAYNDRDLATLKEILADPIELGGEMESRSDFLALVQGYWEAFPDLRFEDPRILAGEDHAVVHVTFEATGSGEFIGHDIDGAEVRASEMILFTMADGQIREYTYEWDELGFWAQLGIIDVSPIEP
jgi:predicted ester cyclase